jgi:branched-chain amino acid transport system ATP-binding protein
MLAVARALMANPKLLLMDEPSMGLSPMLVREVGKIITDINQGGVSIMLVEQNARMALRLAHRAYVLEVGRISLEGDVKKLANDEHVKKAYLGGE